MCEFWTRELLQALPEFQESYLLSLRQHTHIPKRTTASQLLHGEDFHRMFAKTDLWEPLYQLEHESLADPDAQALLAALLQCPASVLYAIPEPGFERDWGVWECMRSHALPKMLKRMRADRARTDAKAWDEILIDQLRVLFFAAFHRLYDEILCEEDAENLNVLTLEASLHWIE